MITRGGRAARSGIGSRESPRLGGSLSQEQSGLLAEPVAAELQLDLAVVGWPGARRRRRLQRPADPEGLVLDVAGRVAEHGQHVLARRRVDLGVRRAVAAAGGYVLLLLLLAAAGEASVLGRDVRGRLPVRRRGLWSVLPAAVAVRREGGRRLVRLLRALFRQHRDVGAVLGALVLGRRQGWLLFLQDYRRLVACGAIAVLY